MAQVYLVNTACTITPMFNVVLDKGQDVERARKILAAACLTIDDRVTSLYAGQVAPENVSVLEKGNYTS